MTGSLGTLEDLPPEYREALAAAGVAPLWPMLRNLLPHHQPQPVTQSHLWAFAQLRPLLLRAGELTPVEKAERRVLVLSDPGRGVGAMQATASIYLGLQLLLPGEAAPAHRHTPSAARIIVEGAGGFTVVQGEKLPMHDGDLVLTPGGYWHDHGHEGDAPVIWLDALDLPIFVYLEGSYAQEAPLQSRRNRPDASEVEYLAAGLRPSRAAGASAPQYPLMRFPWLRTEAALRAMAHHGGPGAVELDYINPETGDAVLPTLGFSALMLRSGDTLRSPLRSTSEVYHVVKGRGEVLIDGVRTRWNDKDTFSVPVFSDLSLSADAEAFLIRIHDRPLQEKLGYYEERER
ncbi:MAG: cupin domain-containing protein [Hyphomonadaceae bacterium]